MSKEFFTLDDFELTGKRVAARIDLNSKFKAGKLLPNERFYAHAATVRELMKRKARIVLLAHQSREGEADFTNLEQHAKVFSEILGKEIRFVGQVVGKEAKREIMKLEDGEAILLDNVRFLKDETRKTSPEVHSTSALVKFLSPLIDYYVLDAFSVAHRSQASIVGFAQIKPMLAGKVMEDELASLKSVLEPLGINAWIMGGTKVDDCIAVLSHMLKKRPESMERVLTGGLLANLFLLASGYEIGSGSLKLLEDKGYLALLPDAKNLVRKYGLELVLPEDVAYERNGKREEENLPAIPREATILDIGSKTIARYKELTDEFRTVVFKGPLGVFERLGFELGTKEILERLATSNLTVLIGGGDTSLAMQKLGVDESKFSHVSVGGGALITYLSGKEMPGINALKKSYLKFKS